MVPDGLHEDAFIESAGAANLNGRCYFPFRPACLRRSCRARARRFVEKYKDEVRRHARGGMPSTATRRPGGPSRRSKQAGKKDRAAILAACLGNQDFDGTLGKWFVRRQRRYDADHNERHIVRDGEFS